MRLARSTGRRGPNVRFPSGRQLIQFLRLSRPHFLVGGFLLYGLGAAIASYLKYGVNIQLYVLGQAMITSTQLMTHYFNEYYDLKADRFNTNRTILSGGSGALGEDGLPPQAALYAGFAAVTINATLAGVLLVSGRAPLISWLLLAMGILGSYFYSVPPVRLVSTGYGEFTAALVVSGLVPAFAFSLQTGSIQSQVILSTLPLVAVTFAMLLLFELPDYPSDLKAGKSTLMVRVGWRNGMWLHDAALVLAFASLGVGYLLGLPYKVAVGPMIAFPLAVAQIWTLWRIRGGAPPRWTMLTISGLVILGLMAYLELAGYLLT